MTMHMERRVTTLDSYQIHGILDGCYRGQVEDGTPHGRGTWGGRGIASGHRYEGEWVHGELHGHGVCTLPDGARYEGELDDHCFHGRGAWRSSDGARFFDGDWTRGWPRSGTALDARNGDLYRAEESEETWISSILEKGGAAPPGWTRAGTLERGHPGAEAFGAGVEWTGAATLADGTRFEGRLRGLRPVAGVVTDAAGARWDVTYGHDAGTLAEAPPPATRQVRRRAPSLEVASAGHTRRD